MSLFSFLFSLSFSLCQRRRAKVLRWEEYYCKMLHDVHETMNRVQVLAVGSGSLVPGYQVLLHYSCKRANSIDPSYGIAVEPPSQRCSQPRTVCPMFSTLARTIDRPRPPSNYYYWTWIKVRNKLGQAGASLGKLEQALSKAFTQLSQDRDSSVQERSRKVLSHHARVVAGIKIDLKTESCLPSRLSSLFRSHVSTVLEIVNSIRNRQQHE